jgi:hypothetical protein
MTYGFDEGRKTNVFGRWTMDDGRWLVACGWPKAGGVLTKDEYPLSHIEWHGTEYGRLTT